VREITKAEAIEAVKKGHGYYSPYAHSPSAGKTGQIVVFTQNRFFFCEHEDLNLEIENVLSFDQGSMIVSHMVRCNNDELGKMLQEEIVKITEKTKHERWAKAFLEDVKESIKDDKTEVVITPKQGRRWYNRFIVEPHDRGAPPNVN
jgi:hypothetical protein